MSSLSGRMGSKDPILTSVVVIVVTFVASAIILYFVKPDFVTKIDTTSSNKVVALDKLFAYSGLISVIVGLLVVVVMCLVAKKQVSQPSSGGMGMTSSFGHQYKYKMGGSCGSPMGGCGVKSPSYMMGSKYSCGCL